MCLIIFKPENIGIPASILSNGFRNNSDGWGIITYKDKKMEISKGLYQQGLINACEELGSEQAAIHLRFATHGIKDTANCHPYQVTEDIWLMHNGIINTVPEIDKTKSDTWHFVEYMVKPLLTQRPELLCTDELEDIILAMAGKSSKFVLAHKDGRIQIINELAGTEKDGLWLSNNSGSYGSAVYNIPALLDGNYSKGICTAGASYSSTVIPAPKFVGGPMSKKQEEQLIDWWEKEEIRYQKGLEKRPSELNDLFEMEWDDLFNFIVECPEEAAELLYYGKSTSEMTDRDRREFGYGDQYEYEKDKTGSGIRWEEEEMDLHAE